MNAYHMQKVLKYFWPSLYMYTTNFQFKRRDQEHMMIALLYFSSEYDFELCYQGFMAPFLHFTAVLAK